MNRKSSSGPFYCRCIMALMSLSFTYCAPDDMAQITEPIMTTNGPIVGNVVALPNGERVKTFLGIPYAEPPLMDLRFKPPVPKKRSNETFYADKFGPLCIQPYKEILWMPIFQNNTRRLEEIELNKNIMDEDCLTLNIYSPFSINQDLPLSVLVYVHGGSYYMNGGRLYPGEKLATEGVIVVTLNYRLGVFGFLSTEDENSPGNYGLLDQVLVLLWVQKNIHNFGGDPDKVTVCGNSAGASSVMLLGMSPLTEGLFRQTLALSGCSGAPWAVQSKPLGYVQTLARSLRCPINNTLYMVECIRTFTSDYILDKIETGNVMGLAFAPVVDGKYGGTFLFDTPEKFYGTGKLRDLPFLMGFTRMEVSSWFLHMNDSHIYSKMSSYSEIKIHLKQGIEVVFAPLELREKNFEAIIHAVVSEYVDRHNMSKDSEYPQLISEFLSDIGLRIPCIRDIDRISQLNNSSTYLFEFDYFSKDDIKMRGLDWVGPYHESDLQYIFGEPFLGYENSLRLPEDKAVSTVIMSPLLNFINTGNPNPLLEKNVVWLEYNSYRRPYLSLSSKATMKEDFYPEKIFFWERFLPLFIKYEFESLSEDNERVVVQQPLWLIWFLLALVAVLCIICIYLLCKSGTCKVHRIFRLMTNRSSLRESCTSV